MAVSLGPGTISTPGNASRAELELMEAVHRGDVLHAAFLIDNGVDTNFRSPQDGWSSLHLSCKQNNIAMVSLLLSRGADQFLKNKLGQIARDLTTSVEVAALLQVTESPVMSSYHLKSDNLTNDLPQNMLNHVIFKVRIFNSSDPDFIEIELPCKTANYQNLVNICAQELEIRPEQISRIRKLPDTRIRCDADIKRLKPMQELEVVLKENQLPVSHLVSTNIYPSIAANKNQTVLY